MSSRVMDLKHALNPDDDAHIKKEEYPHSSSNVYSLSSSSQYHNLSHHSPSLDPSLDMSKSTGYTPDTVSPHSPYQVTNQFFQQDFDGSDMGMMGRVPMENALMMGDSTSGVSQYGMCHNREPEVRLTPVTGRPSRAKKGIAVHKCHDCDKVFTRAEHLRRHHLSHGTPQFACRFDGCQRMFHRKDLLDRHVQKHETESSENPQSAFNSSKKHVNHHGSGGGSGSGKHSRPSTVETSLQLPPRSGNELLPHNLHFNGGIPTDPYSAIFTNSSPSVANQTFGHPTPGFSSTATSTTPMFSSDYPLVDFDASGSPNFLTHQIENSMGTGMSQMCPGSQLSYLQQQQQQQPRADQFCQPRSYMFQSTLGSSPHETPDYTAPLSFISPYGEFLPEAADTSFSMLSYHADHYSHSVS